MNNYEDWSRLVAKDLKGEADLIAAIEKDELEDSAAKQAFISSVLDPFLPESYAIGSGRVVDSKGNYSQHLDIVIYNRDFPRIGLRGTHSTYLHESVLAAFVIKAKLLRKTFFEALDCCASLGALDANIDKAVLRKLANKNDMALDQNNEYMHPDLLRTARFKMIGRPPAFVFGFGGIKNSYRQLQENIGLWLDQRQQQGASVEMKSLPAVIATQGCFAWRNAAPLALSNSQMMGIGVDSAPIRLIVLQLLHLMNRRLNVQSDGYGLKPNLATYLKQFSAPDFVSAVGNLDGAGNIKPKEKPALPEVTEPEPVKEAKVAAVKNVVTAPAISVVPPKPPVDFPLMAEEEAPRSADEQPSSGSIGSPSSVGESSASTLGSPSSTSKPAASSFGSPSSTSEPAASSFGSPSSTSKPAASSFGSPSSTSESAKSSFGSPSSTREPAASSFGSPSSTSESAKSSFGSPSSTSEAAASSFGSPSSTSEPAASSSGSAKSSTDAFIERVKQQMTGSDPFAEFPSEKAADADPFSSTIPK